MLEHTDGGLLVEEKAMSNSPLDVLEYSERVAKRAQWEAFEYTLLGDGDVEVVNSSHEEPEEHTYTVHVEGGIPAHCTCPAWEYQEGACKHMVSVAIREPVREAAGETSQLRADGGVSVESEADSDERPDDCDCSPLFEELPCWPCYRDGFEEPAEVSDE